MPVSQRQMAEIAKAVSFNSKIIVFDEPTSSLTEEEVEHLFKIINMLRDQGCGIIYISHKMAEILRISDDITVMRDGTWVATKPAKEMTMDEIIRLMVGRELTNQFPPKTNKPGDVALEVENLTAQYSLLRVWPVWTEADVLKHWRTSSVLQQENQERSNWTVRFVQTATHVNRSRTVSPF